MAAVASGVAIFPSEGPQQMLEMVRLAEALGYNYLWFGDSQVIWRECYVLMGGAAVQTKRAILGTAVTNPVTRDLTVTASVFATLSELTGGRVALGMGAGDSSLETLGKRPATLARLEEAIRILRGLLAGERVGYEGGEIHMDWVKIPKVPIFIGASGPRILSLSGKVADGTIILVGIAPEYLQGAFARIQEGAQEAGRDLQAEGFKYVCWVPCAIEADGKVARDSVKAHVARILKRPLPFELSEEDKAVQKQIYEHYEYYQHLVAGTKHGELVPDRLVSKFAIAGTVAECREQVRQLKATGIHQIAIIPHTLNPADRLRVVRTFAEEVMAKL